MYDFLPTSGMVLTLRIWVRKLIFYASYTTSQSQGAFRRIRIHAWPNTDKGCTKQISFPTGRENVRFFASAKNSGKLAFSRTKPYFLRVSRNVATVGQICIAFGKFRIREATIFCRREKFNFA